MSTIAQRTADLDLIGYAIQRALRNGASVEQVEDAVSYTRNRFLVNPDHDYTATSRVGSYHDVFLRLAQAVSEYREFKAQWDFDDPKMNWPAHDEAEVGYLKAVCDAATEVA